MGKLSDVRWGRVLVAAIAAFAGGFAVVLLVLTVYVTFAGADAVELTSFSQNLVPLIVAALTPVLLTFLGARWEIER